MKQKLDIVTSAYNEEDSLVELYERLKLVLDAEIGYQWRLIICENVSSDNTWQVITSIAHKDSRVLGIQFSRNFYLDGGLTCGLDHCDGDLVVVMCSDLQDPPELIPNMLRKYEEGFQQVLMRVDSRDSVGFIRRKLTNIFYWLINRMSGGLVPGNISDFRLLSRKAYIAARSLREQKRFLRGLMSWSGFKSCEISFNRPTRKYGDSKFSSRRLLNVMGEAIESVYAFSTFPLRFISGMGTLFSLLSFCAMFLMIYRVLRFGVPFPGFGTLILINLATFSLLLFALGVIATYVGLIYEETKNRPLYIINKTTLD